MITFGRCGARLKEKVNVDMSLVFWGFLNFFYSCGSRTT